MAGVKSLPDIHDRVTDAFNGRMGEKFAQLTRSRIHWICANVIGKRVLDAGCSQGIAAILLGREGHKVIGVDLSTRSIEEARGFLAQEPSWVQANVELWNGDFLASSLDAQLFDTIIFGEILEHLTQPQAFVDAAAKRLAENGRLIVTVPFGINDWPDHRRTFYLLEPWCLLSRHFEVTDVKLFGKWIGFVARLRPPEDATAEILPSADVYAAAEAAVYQIERRLTDERNELLRELKAHRADFAVQTEQSAAAQDKLARAEAATQEAKDTSEALGRRLREAERMSSALQAAAEFTARRLGDEYATLALEKANLERQVDELRGQLSQAEKAAEDLEIEIVAIRAEVGARDARITALQSQLEVYTRTLAAERSAIGEMAESRRDVQNYAEMLSERLIEVLDDLRVRKVKLDALSANATERDRENARLAGAVAAAQRDGAKLRQELQSARQREQTERAGSRSLADELEAARRGASTERADNAELKNQLQQAASRSMTLRKQIDALEKQKAAAEQQAAKAKQTISFQLGYALLQAGRSWHGAVALPKAILGLIREERERKLTKKAGKNRAADSRRGEQDRSISLPLQKIETAPPKIQALSILDEISEASWGAELKLFRLQRKKFEQQIANSNSQFAFLESCWKGNAGDWEYAFTSPNLKHANAQDLIKALKLMRVRGMTIVFWNKEDPMHYDKYLPIAKYADVILTTDANKVVSYGRDVPTARVEVLPFAAQPHLCNPSGRTNIQQESVCFAGSYYNVGHDDRKRQMDELLPAVIEHGGSIYDRMSRIDGGRYSYPGQYAPCIRAAVPFTEMTRVYKSFKVFLNVNTITDSPTMMSRRVYELLACGTPVVSAPSKAIDEAFSGIVQIARTKAQAIDCVGRLLHDEDFHSRIAHLGYREVMRKHTYRSRLSVMLPAIGMPFVDVAPLVTVVLCTMRPHMIHRIAENLTRQTCDRFEVIIVTQRFSGEQRDRLSNAIRARSSNIGRLEVVADDSERSLGERLNYAVSLARGDYIAKMDDDDLYFDNYLNDMLIPFTFGSFGLVGKKELFMYLEGSGRLIRRYAGMRHRVTDFVSGATFVARREVFQSIPFAPINQGEDSSFIEHVKAAGLSIYASDSYNFVGWRHAKVEDHTWRAGDREFLESAQTVLEGNEADFQRVCVV